MDAGYREDHPNLSLDTCYKKAGCDGCIYAAKKFITLVFCVRIAVDNLVVSSISPKCIKMAWPI